MIMFLPHGHFFSRVTSHGSGICPWLSSEPFRELPDVPHDPEIRPDLPPEQQPDLFPEIPDAPAPDILPDRNEPEISPTPEF